MIFRRVTNGVAVNLTTDSWGLKMAPQTEVSIPRDQHLLIH